MYRYIYKYTLRFESGMLYNSAVMCKCANVQMFMRQTVGLWGDLRDGLGQENVFESGGFAKQSSCQPEGSSLNSVQTVCIQGVKGLQRWYLPSS